MRTCLIDFTFENTEQNIEAGEKTFWCIKPDRTFCSSILRKKKKNVLFSQMSEMVEVSRTSTLELQNQLDEYKEKNHRELAEVQRQLKEKTLEVEKSRLTTMRMQDEVMTHKFSDKF